MNIKFTQMQIWKVCHVDGRVLILPDLNIHKEEKKTNLELLHNMWGKKSVATPNTSS